jgi:hypothetical protein
MIRKKTAKPHYQPIVLILAATLVAACTSAPTPASPPTAVPPTGIVTVSVPTNPPPTIAPTAMPPTPTVLHAMPTDSPPTVTPTAVPPTPTNTATAVPPTPVPQTEIAPERTDSMKIRITLEDAVLTATLTDSQTTRDFVSLLPLTLTLEDYAGTEKISYLPQKLSTEDAPPGSDPSVGDITYYAPWGNLAIFYRDFGYASGLVILGKIDSDVEALDVPGPIEATIELLK